MFGAEEFALWFLLIVATITDIRKGKIYNLLTFPLMGLALAFRFWTGGAESILQGFIGIGVALATFLPFYILGAFAAGDVKLLMALGAWGGYMLVIKLGIFGILVGAAVGLVLLLRQKGVFKSLKSLKEHLTKRSPQTDPLKMPFAPAFLCGFLLLKISEVYRWEFFVG